MSAIPHHGFGRTCSIEPDSVGAVIRDGIAAGLFVLAIVVICLAMGA